MSKLVLDTNILVSATLKAGSVPDLCLRSALYAGEVLLVSKDVLREYERVLSLPRLKLSDAKVKGLFKDITQLSQVVEPKVSLFLCSDPDDDIFLELALAGEADYVVTGNRRHFPESVPFTKVISAREYIDQFIMQNNPEDLG